MDVCVKTNETELTAILISPDRDMAVEFTSTLGHSRAFKIVSDLKDYPSRQALESRLRQLRPDVVFVDVCSNHDEATDVIRFVAAHEQSIYAIGLDRSQSSEMLLSALRAGATEFLQSPFDIAIQAEAVARLRRLRSPDSPVISQPGIVNAFASCKPGSGSSTIAVQTALALKRTTGKRVLLIDFDLCRGMLSFFLKLSHHASILDALEISHRLTPTLWSDFVVERGGIDVLCAPETPYQGPIDSVSLNALVGYARNHYDWIIIDLPVIFQRLSLLTLSTADGAFLVTTAELPSLHLARKAISMLDQLGIAKDRFQIVVNRTNKRFDLGNAEIEKLFSWKVHSRIPNDFASINRANSYGEPVDSKSDIGRAIEGLASRLSGPVIAPSLRSSNPDSLRLLAQVG